MSSDAISQFDILTLLRKYSDKSAFRLVAPGTTSATNFGISVSKSGDLIDYPFVRNLRFNCDPFLVLDY